METFFGIKILASPLIPETAPRIQLSPDVMVTGAFRAEMNAWLLEFFGETRSYYVMHGGRTIAANPRSIDWLKREIRRNANAR